MSCSRGSATSSTRRRRNNLRAFMGLRWSTTTGQTCLLRGGRASDQLDLVVRGRILQNCGISAHTGPVSMLGDAPISVTVASGSGPVLPHDIILWLVVYPHLSSLAGIKRQEVSTRMARPGLSDVVKLPASPQQLLGYRNAMCNCNYVDTGKPQGHTSKVLSDPPAGKKLRHDLVFADNTSSSHLGDRNSRRERAYDGRFLIYWIGGFGYSYWT
ncbi:hypothetical protein EDB83DRAFT_318207 [Lactarius deliciosus]|nr:hypothetical protein EDB83DRAFT_318207 [Lactarius deliciosus]